MSSVSFSAASCINRQAVASPAGPPPTITTSNSIDSRASSATYRLLNPQGIVGLYARPPLIPHVLDLGSEGDRGGELVAQGTPEDIAVSPRSDAGYLRARL